MPIISEAKKGSGLLYIFSSTVYSNNAKTVRFICRKYEALLSSDSKANTGNYLHIIPSILLYYLIQCLVEDEFIIVTNGGPSAKTQVFNVIEQGSEYDGTHSRRSDLVECAHSLESPQEVDWGTGGFLVHDKKDNYTAIICGGRDTDDSTIENGFCFSHNDPNIQRQFSGALSETRIGAASLIIDGGPLLWITGGKNSKHGSFSSTEIVQLVESQFVSRAGPSLPRDLHHHCLEKIGPEVAILIGGLTSYQTTGDYIVVYNHISWSVNLETMAWTLQAQLTTPRQKHVCGVIRIAEGDDSGDQVIIVAAGGDREWHDGSVVVQQSVEFLVWDSINEDGDSLMYSNWEAGPNLPLAVRDASSITTANQNRMYVVGGSTGAYNEVNFMQLSIILELSCPSMAACAWTNVYEMDRPMSKGIMFSVPTKPMTGNMIPDVSCPMLDQIKG